MDVFFSDRAGRKDFNDVFGMKAAVILEMARQREAQALEIGGQQVSQTAFARNSIAGGAAVGFVKGFCWRGIRKPLN